MIFGRIWKSLGSVARLAGGRGGRGIRSAEEFREIIDRERTRCDRNSHEFSLMLIRLDEVGNAKGFLRALTDVLARRIRCTDDYGWLDSRQIGIVLPDTPNWGGKKFAEDVREQLRTRGQDLPDFAVYTYPAHCMPGGDGGNGNGDSRQLTFADTGGNGRNDETRKGEAEESTRSTDRPVGERAVPDRNGMSGIDTIGMVSRSSVPRWKRIMDCAGAGLMILTWSPLFALAALWIKLVSPGPLFFVHDRIGRSGQTFRCWKLRTMRPNVATAPHVKHVKNLINGNGGEAGAEPMAKLDERDDRIVPFGQIIRLVGLDELPQLINVFRGEMSLVGPRPCLPYEYEEYTLWHTRRCDTLPGLTGLWQVSGKNRTSFLEMMRLDISYSRHLSFWRDVKILLLTVPAIIGQIRQ